MKYTSYSYPSGRAEVAAFVVTGGVTEYHVMIHATDPKQTYREQMNVVLDAYAALLKKELSGAVAVFKRYFLSDAANQAELLLAATAESSDCALSVVEQPPLDGTKIALWAYLQTDVQTRVLPNGLYEVKHGVLPPDLDGRQLQSCRQFGIPDASFAQRLCHATDGGRVYSGRQLPAYLDICAECGLQLCRCSQGT